MPRHLLACRRPTRIALPPAFLVALAAALGCATAPAPPPDAALVCGPGSRRIAWQELDVPPDTRPIDLALSADAVWVLFETSFVVRVPRAADAELEPLYVSPPREAERWLAVDVDPADGTLWLARRDAYEMVQVVGSGARRVPLQRVIGEGGLIEIVAGSDAMHVAPFCADHALWSFDRQGEMLRTSFELPQGLGLEVDPSRPITMKHACTRLHVARDASGDVFAFHPVDVRLHRATAGGWEEIGGPFDIRPPDRYDSGYRVRGFGSEDFGSYLPDSVDALVFLAGRPTLLGSSLVGPNGSVGTVLYRIVDDQLHPVVEHCGGERLLDLEADAAGHAAVTEDALILGATPER